MKHKDNAFPSCMFEKAFQILDCVSYCLTERCKRYSEKYTLTSYDNESLKKYKI